jgi:hypothetical protein
MAPPILSRQLLNLADFAEIAPQIGVNMRDLQNHPYMR